MTNCIKIFQFLILGYGVVWGQGLVGQGGFQFLILGYRPKHDAGKQPGQRFQFLILGYKVEEELRRTAIYYSFNSSFQDTKARPSKSFSKRAFNSSFQDTNTPRHHYPPPSQFFQFLILGYGKKGKDYYSSIIINLSIPHFRIPNSAPLCDCPCHSSFQFLILGYSHRLTIILQLDELSIPHFRIPDSQQARRRMGRGLSIPHFRIPNEKYKCVACSYISFQFLILGYRRLHVAGVVTHPYLSIPHFRIQTSRRQTDVPLCSRLSIPHFRILAQSGFDPKLFWHATFNSSFQDTGYKLEFDHKRVLNFQFLILGYRTHSYCSSANNIRTFNSSFQDTLQWLKVMLTVYYSFNSSFQDTVMRTS